MNFRTEIKIEPYPFSISHANRIFMMGSCFSQHIGEKLKRFKFNVLSNPFGVVYNPESILKLIQNIQSKHFYTEDDLFYADGLWHSFDHHGSFSAPDKKMCLTQINASLEHAISEVKRANVFVFTLGTSFVYRLVENAQTVVNCHKLPAKTFERVQLKAEELNNVLEDIIQHVHHINPSAQVMFTVSPIRHLKDGFVQNSLSKAGLICAVHHAIERYKHTYYFPSFEIMMDDLRDYRFYSSDLTHVSETAIAYIWENFKTSLMTEETISLLQLLAKIDQAIHHRPRNPSTDEHKQFLINTREKLTLLENKYKTLNFEEERGRLNEQLDKWKSV